jgi:rare lipoprotein A
MNVQKLDLAFRAAVVSLSVVVVLTSCVPRKPLLSRGGLQTGEASWYGPDFHGKPTSNREIYDMFDMTAAHNTLSFGTRVMVTNLNNGRSVVVRINDRGPFVGERIIDVSYAAARLLDMVGSGVVPVRLEVLNGPRSVPSPVPRYSVQVGSFIDKQNALALETRLKMSYRSVYVSEFRTPNQVYYRVRLRAADRAEADKLAQRLYEDGFRVLILEDDELFP